MNYCITNLESMLELSKKSKREQLIFLYNFSVNMMDLTEQTDEEEIYIEMYNLIKKLKEGLDE